MNCVITFLEVIFIRGDKKLILCKIYDLIAEQNS